MTNAAVAPSFNFVLLEELNEDQRNPRAIAPASLEGLKHSIILSTAKMADWNTADGYRLATTITVNKRNMTIVGGHQRCKALLALGQDWIHSDDITWVDAEDHVDLLLELNSEEVSGHWTPGAFPLLDAEKLRDASQAGALRMDALRARLRQERPWERYAGREAADREEGEQIPPAPEVAVTEVGDVWILGEHRLVCGDATDPAAIEALMGDGLAGETNQDREPVGWNPAVGEVAINGDVHRPVAETGLNARPGER